MQTFRLDHNNYPVHRRRTLLQHCLSFTLATVVVLAFLNRGGLTLSLEGFISLICAAIPGLLIGALFTWANLRHLHSQWFSYELILADDWIRQRAERLPDVKLQRSQIATIEEYPNSGLRLRTSDKNVYVVVPAGLAEYATVRNHVASWHPIVQKQSATQQAVLCLIGGALALILMAALSIADSVLGVIAVAILFMGTSTWGAVHIQRSRTAPSWFKIFIWVGLVLLLTITVERILTVM